MPPLHNAQEGDVYILRRGVLVKWDHPTAEELRPLPGANLVGVLAFGTICFLVGFGLGMLIAAITPR